MILIKDFTNIEDFKIVYVFNNDLNYSIADVQLFFYQVSKSEIIETTDVYPIMFSEHEVYPLRSEKLPFFLKELPNGN